MNAPKIIELDLKNQQIQAQQIDPDISVQALAMQLAQVDLSALSEASTDDYGQVEPGVVTIVQGLQQIVDAFVSGSAQVGLRLAFSILESALKSPCNSNTTAEEVQARATCLAEIDFSQLTGTEEYCKVEPGIVTIVQGLQQIADAFVSGSAPLGVDIAFSTLQAALKSPCSNADSADLA